MCLVSCDLLDILTPQDPTPQDSTPEHTHSFGEWSVTKNATCTEDGVKTRYCNCGEKQSETVPTINHTEVIDEAVAPTCTDLGKTEGSHCSTCGLVLVQQDVIPTISHSYNYNNKCSVCGIIYDAGCAHEEIQILPGYAATCAETGRTEGKCCAICGAVVVKQYTISTIDHLYMEEYSSDEIYHWYECKTCGTKKENKEHQVGGDGTCTTCGQIDCATPGIKYAKSSDGTYAIVQIYQGSAKNVKIANTYQGLPVKTIAAHAFNQNYSTTSIIIPDSVTSIGNYAFYKCTSLTSIVIPDNVTYIGDSVFTYCSKLTSIVIPGSVTSIGDDSFQNCSSLTSVLIPDSVTSIGKDAFYECISLTSVVIPDNVTYIGNNAFRGCSALTSVVVPNSVTTIGDSTFAYCSKLTSAVIGNNVTSIGDFAFNGCYSLASVVIGDSVTFIGMMAFFDCSKLQDVYYTGSKEEWKNITIDWNNYSLTGATRHYNYVPEN